MLKWFRAPLAASLLCTGLIAHVPALAQSSSDWPNRTITIVAPQPPGGGFDTVARVLADPNSAIPDMIRETLKLLIEEIRLMEARITQIERELTQVAKDSEPCRNCSATQT